MINMGRLRQKSYMSNPMEMEESMLFQFIDSIDVMKRLKEFNIY